MTPPTAPPTVLLLDVMDTLVFDPYATAQPAFFGMSREELWREKHPTAWVDFELGRLSEDEYLERYFADGRPFDHEAFRQCIKQSYRWLEGMQELLAALHGRGVEMHAHSNYPVWFRFIEEKLGLSRFLKWSFVSCRTGMRKPDPESFRGAARALGISSDRCLFVDDREENCRAATSVGMDTVAFRGAQDLKAELGLRGLL